MTLSRILSQEATLRYIPMKRRSKPRKMSAGDPGNMAAKTEERQRNSPVTAKGRLGAELYKKLQPENRELLGGGGGGGLSPKEIMNQKIM